MQNSGISFRSPRICCTDVFEASVVQNVSSGRYQASSQESKESVTYPYKDGGRQRTLRSATSVCSGGSNVVKKQGHAFLQRGSLPLFLVRPGV